MHEQCRICGGELGFMAAHYSHFCAKCGESVKEMPKAHLAIVFALTDRIRALEARQSREKERA